MFNTSSWQSHKEYQTIVRNSKARFNSDSRSLFRGQLEGIYRKQSRSLYTELSLHIIIFPEKREIRFFFFQISPQAPSVLSCFWRDCPL